MIRSQLMRPTSYWVKIQPWKIASKPQSKEASGRAKARQMKTTTTLAVSGNGAPPNQIGDGVYSAQSHKSERAASIPWLVRFIAVSSPALHGEASARRLFRLSPLARKGRSRAIHREDFALIAQ